MAVPNCECFEVLPPDEAIRHRLVDDIEVDSEDYVPAAEEPVLAYEIDLGLVKH